MLKLKTDWFLQNLLKKETDAFLFVCLFWFLVWVGWIAPSWAALIRSGNFVEVAAALARGSLLLVVVVVIVCFQERGEICVSPCLLPPGKASVTVGVARRRDAEHPDAQVGGNLEAHACAVAHQIQKREDLKRKHVTSANFKSNNCYKRILLVKLLFPSIVGLCGVPTISQYLTCRRQQFRTSVWSIRKKYGDFKAAV